MAGNAHEVATREALLAIKMHPSLSCLLQASSEVFVLVVFLWTVVEVTIALIVTLGIVCLKSIDVVVTITLTVFSVSVVTGSEWHPLTRTVKPTLATFAVAVRLSQEVVERLHLSLVESLC